MVSEIFRTLELVGPRHASESTPESGISNFKRSCKTMLCTIG